MKLIDADALMKKIREVDFVADVDLMKITHDSMLTGFFHGSVQGIVDRLPTAYDPDKIVEQLEAETKSVYNEIQGDYFNYVEIDKAIEIVKSGGAE